MLIVRRRKMACSTVSSKGQVTIPSQVRERMGIYQGTQLLFVDDGDRILVYKLEGDLESVYGAFPHKGKKPIDFKALREETAKKVAKETGRVFEKGSRTG
jgi:antitoxin PrlF